MKAFLVAIGTILLYIFVTVFNTDYNWMENKNFELKYVAEELSASATLFINIEEYSNGRKVFNQEEAGKAVAQQIKNLLRLDDDFDPLTNSYWQERVTYTIYFYDDSNTAYPFNFIDAATGFAYTVTHPTVIVTINAGKPRHRLEPFRNLPPVIRSAAHEWKER